MSLRDGVVAVFLGLGVLVTLLSVVGVIVSRNVYQRLHFVTPGAVLAPLLVAAAVVAKRHSTSADSRRSPRSWPWSCSDPS